MKTNISGKYTCPFTGTSDNLDWQNKCTGGNEDGCHFWDEEENTCQEIVKVQLQRETNVLLNGIKLLLTEDKPITTTDFPKCDESKRVFLEKEVAPEEKEFVIRSEVAASAKKVNPRAKITTPADLIKSISASKKEKQ